MQVENTFSVDAPAEKVWAYLLDVQALAPCVPGAELTEVVSDTEYKGTVRVKLGAVQVNYRGTLVLKEVDHDGHRVVLSATGNETRGTGGASSLVTSTITGDGPNRTTVHILSEIVVSGKVAQFGRNIMQDVSNRLIKDFASCLEANINAADEQVEQTLSSESVANGNDLATQVSPSDGQSVSEQLPVPTRVVVASSTRPPGAAAVDIKIMPLVLDITRSRVARGLRRVAKVLDPER